MADIGVGASQYAINASAGAYTTLRGKRLSKAIEIYEDFSANAGVGQGLTYMTPDPNSTPDNIQWLGPFSMGPTTEPIVLGDKYAIHQPWGGSVANGPGVTLGVGPTLGTPFIMIKSSGSSTTINVFEYS